MATETDFNVPPYFDDYDEEKRFHKILFRPSMAVQARELTQSQTILQNQIERFGNHMFKDGSIVDGVGIAYYPAIDYISVEDRFSFANGAQSEIFPSELNSSYIVTNSTDSNVAVRATIRIAKDGTKTDPPNTNRFYLDYVTTGKNVSNNTLDVNIFVPGDTLYIYANTQNKFGTLIANNLLYTVNTLATNSTFTANGQAYCVSVSEGTIFQKGFFTKVESQIITVRDFSTNVAGYVVGFDTTEEIIDENDDPSLTDNALGYSNENAPGAHRLKLTPTLVAKSRSDTANNKNFFAIVEFDRDQPTEQKDRPEYNKIMDQFASRTYEESGNYIIHPFKMEARTNSANSQTFYYEISPGVAYVRGYRIEKLAPVYIEAPRATTTEVAQNQIITANYGSYVVCDEFLGVFDTEQLSEVTLYDAPQNAISEYEGTTSPRTGNIVGKANVRAVVFEDGIKGSPTAKYLVYLFNIRMDSGKSFGADVKSLYMSGTNGQAKADVVLENDVAVLKETTRSSSVLNTGLFAIKRLTNNTGIGDTSYVYSQIKSATMLANGGITTVSIDTAAPGASTERLNDGVGSVLTGSALESYNIYLSSNAYTANLTGSIEITSGSAAITGTSTLFTTELTANSLVRIYANTTQTYIRRVVSIANSTSLTLDATLPASNSSTSFGKYFVTGTPLPLANVTINSTTSFSAVANIGAAFDSGNQTVYCEYPVNRNQAVSIPKVINKNRFVKIDCSTNVANTVGPWILGLPDVHKIRHVYVGTTYANTNPDRLSWFNLDTGQRDEMYDHARLVIKPQYASNITSSTRILVELDHFTANTVASVGFFSVESYPIDDANTANTNAIQTIEIPQYNNLELRNFIDFRAYKSNTAVSSSTEAGATINPAANANTFAISGTGQYMIIPDSNFTGDFEYYLPRIDVITVDTRGNFNVVQGIPSQTPSVPFFETDQMGLAESAVPAYPSATKREYDSSISSSFSFTKINILKNKRYTMKDIGKLENRIKRLEYYTVLNALEQYTSSLTIPDANGLDRFKNGIFADPFNSHNIGNVGDFEYKIAIDKDETVARPFFQRHDVDFTLNKNSSSNIQVTGPVVTLPYTSELYIQQRFATKTRIAAESFWQWNGFLNLYPSTDFFRDEEPAPDSNVTIDLATPWTTFANSPFGMHYADWLETGTATSSSTSVNNTGTSTVVTTTTTTTTDLERIVSDLTVDTFSETFEIGNYVTDISINPYMRSRLVAFIATSMKPNTTLYPFFDDTNVSEHCAPGTLSGLSEVEVGQENRIVNQNGNFGDPLISDSNGFICGIFRIPASSFRTGDRLFQLVNVDNLTRGDTIITSAKGKYTADNVTVTTQTATLTVIQPTLGISQTTETRTDTTVTTNVTVIPLPQPDPGGGGDGFSNFGGDASPDPIAQSFSIESLPDSLSSIFVSQVGVFFRQKDLQLGCTLYICEMTNGFPDANKIIAKSYLPSTSINVSDDGSAETVFNLEYPVCLLGNGDYTFVVQPDANSPEYVIWVAETGGFDIVSGEQVYVNPYIGTMFLSANQRTWTVYQKEDLKFNIYRAKFNPLSGTAIFNNENDEYITVDGFTRANTSLAIQVGDSVYTVNTSSLPVQNTLTIVANTLKTAVTGRIQYVNEAEGELWIDSSTANTSSYFSNSVNSTIAIYRPSNRSVLSNINENTLIAYANILSVDNLKYHAVVPKFGTLQPSKTSLAFKFAGTSTSNIIDTNKQDVINGIHHEFTTNEKHAMSKSNEILSLSSGKSSSFDIILSSQSQYSSPVISLQKKSSLFIENLINNDYTNEHTRYGNALTKYVSKRIILADGQEAEDLKVYLTAYRPVDTDIKIYAKFWNNQDPQPFDDKVWTELQYVNGGNLIYSSPVDTKNFIEYEFFVPSYDANTLTTIPQSAFANTGSEKIIAGTINTVENSNIITGVGTSFGAAGEVSVGDRVRIILGNSFAVRTVTNISSTTSLTVNEGLKETATGTIAYVFDTGGNDGIVEYRNSDGSRFIGYKEVALKIVLLSSNAVRVPRLNDVRAICLQI